MFLKFLEVIGGLIMALAFIGMIVFIVYRYHYAKDLEDYITSHKAFTIKGEERFCQFTERQIQVNNLKKQLKELQAQKR